jgi:glycosyltransferase involved in cell wall biosynthesis
MSNRTDRASSKHVLILSQYMYPEQNSTGGLLTSLAVGLAEQGFNVTAYSAQPTYYERGEEVSRHLVYKGVRIERMRNTRFGRSRLILRAIDGLTFALSTAVRLLRSPAHWIVFAVTNPPFLPVIAAIRRRFGNGQFFLLVHDVYPEAAVQLKTIRAGGLIHRTWMRVDRFTLSQADRVIVLGEDMREVLARKLPSNQQDKVVVIQNWADGDAVVPKDKTSSVNARQNALVEPFVVQYSGNVGLSQGLEVVLDAADLLRGEDVVFTIVGQGVVLARLKAAAAERGLSSIRFLSRAPDAELADSLAACDAALVPLSAGMEGLSVPSKYYVVLASGRPVLAMMNVGSEVARSVVENDCGIVVGPGDADGLRRAILRLKADRALLSRLGQNARRAFEQRYTRRRALEEYSSLLEGPSSTARAYKSIPDRTGSAL